MVRWKLFDLGKFPSTIYGKTLKLILSVFLPVLLIASAPTRALFYDLSYYEYIAIMGVTLFFHLFMRWFWEKGVSRYESANG